MSLCCLFKEPAWFFDNNINESSMLPKCSRLGYLNRAVWLSMWCHFFDIYSVKQFWGPREATFSSWILSRGLYCAHELRASNLKGLLWRLFDNLICVFHTLTSYICSNILNECFLFHPILRCSLFKKTAQFWFCEICLLTSKFWPPVDGIKLVWYLELGCF